MRKSLLAGLLLAFAPSVQAHEVWIERDASGPARIYLGEPAEPVPEGGDPEFAKLKAPRLIGTSAALSRQTTHLAVEVPAGTELRLTDDSIFAPWKTDEGKLEGAVFYAREGRRESRAMLDLEIVPVAGAADRFTVIHGGKPLPDAAVNVVNPDRWSKSFKADDAGVVAIPTDAKGRYILVVNHGVEGAREIQGQSVAKTYHISTLTFVND